MRRRHSARLPARRPLWPMDAERLQLRLASILVPLSASAGSGEDGGVVARMLQIGLRRSQQPGPDRPWHAEPRLTSAPDETANYACTVCQVQHAVRRRRSLHDAGGKGDICGLPETATIRHALQPASTNLALCHQRRPFSNYLPSTTYLFLRVLLDLPRASLPPPPGARRIRLELLYIPDVCMVPVAPFLPDLPSCLRTVCTYTCIK